MDYKIKDFYGRELVVQPRLSLYSVRDFVGKEMPGLAITLIDATDSNDPTDYCDLTVSFGEFIGMKNCAYIDLNNCPFATKFLQEGVAADTGFTKQSGMCTYPLWQFKEEFLKEHGEENYKLYSDEYDQYMSIMNVGDDEDEDLEEDQTEEMSMQL